MEIIEIIGFISAVIGIYLSAEKKIYAWPINIFSAGAYSLFFYEIRLYADALLQLFFIASSCYGWYNWSKISNENNDQLKIKILGFKKLFLSVISILILGFITGYLFRTFTNADYAYFDSVLFSASIITTILSAKLFLENWYLWIIINFAYILLYLLKSAELTAILYLILLGLAILGLIKWRKNIHV